MNLPSGTIYEETLHGSSECETFLASENGQQVVVKTPDPVGGFLGVIEFDGQEEVHRDARRSQFEREKLREQRVAETSDYFLKGRFEKTDDSLYWVRTYHPRSLKERVLLKEKPDGRELGTICRSIASALAELDRVDQSGHGNLTVSNVLVASDGCSRLRLVDLKSASPGHAAADRRALGLIIYQLVNSEFVQQEDRLTTVPSDQDWRILGSSAAKWREFCSELLDPHGKFVGANWEQIAQEIRAFSDGGSAKLKISAVAVLCLAISVAVLFLVKPWSGEKSAPVNLATAEEYWPQLVEHFFNWGDYYLRSGGPRDFRQSDRERKKFHEDFFPQEDASLPRNLIMRLLEVDDNDLRNAHGNEEKKRELIEGSESIALAELGQAQLDEIGQSFAILDGLKAKIEDWEVLVALENSHRAFEEAGFTFGVSQTEELRGIASFEDNSLTLERLYSLKPRVAALDDLLATYAAFEESTSSLENATDSGFLPEYAKNLRQRLRESPAESSIGVLGELAREAGEVYRFWMGQRKRLALAPFQRNERLLLSESDFSVSEKSLVRWKSLLSEYQRLERQPEALKDATVDFARVDERIKDLDSAINDWRSVDPSSAVSDPEFQRVSDDFGQVSRSFIELRKNFEDDFNEEAGRIPLIAKNKSRIDSGVGDYLEKLKGLELRLESLNEGVKPDIGAGLRQMAEMPPEMLGLDESLKNAWREYSDSVRQLSEGSFDDDNAYRKFKRQHDAKRDRFIEFEQKYLSRLPGLPVGWEQQVPVKLRASVESLSQQKSRGIREDWTESAIPFLLDEKRVSKLDELAEAFPGRMRQFNDDLIRYAERLGSVVEALETWTPPVGGFESIRDELQSFQQHAEWSRTAGFDEVFQQLEVLREVNDGNGLAEVLGNSSQAGFLRYSAFQKIADSVPLTIGRIESFTASVEDLRNLIEDPSAKISDQIKNEFQARRSRLWIEAFKQTRTREDRERALRVADSYGVDSNQLEGRVRIAFKLGSIFSQLKSESSAERYRRDPGELDAVRDALGELADSTGDEGLKVLVLGLREISTSDEVEDPYEKGKSIGRWQVVDRAEDDSSVDLQWEQHRIRFVLIGDFYLSETECSVGLFNDWMTKNKNWENQNWEDHFPDGFELDVQYRRGMKIWEPNRRFRSRGITMQGAWLDYGQFVTERRNPSGTDAAEPEQLRALFEEELNLFPPEALNEALPIQHISAKLAWQFARDMGMLLPTRSQWNAAAEASPVVGQPTFWQARLDRSDLLFTTERNSIREGSFYFETNIDQNRPGEYSGPALQAVDSGSGRLKHLAGNVAEYLFDPRDPAKPDASQGDFFVAGGSGLAAVADSWKQQLEVRFGDFAYSDVGLRLALPGPNKSAYHQILGKIEDYWSGFTYEN